MNQFLTRIPFINLNHQQQEIQPLLTEAIQQVMEDQDYILGQSLAEFEVEFSSACNATYGIGVGSGTDAIALGLQACGITQGDEVILPTNIFAGTVMAVLQARALPVLVDCDPETALMDLMAAEKAISPRTRAILPVHLYGQMVSPLYLLNLASIYDLLIFEDARYAPLAESKGYRAGSVGTAAAFSFSPVRNLAALGDGGMVVTRDETVAQTMRSLRNYGAPRRYRHTDFGINSRLDTLHAAVLKAKLPQLTNWTAERRRIAQRYENLLQPLASQGIVPIATQPEQCHAYNLFVIRVTATCPIDRSALQTELAAQGIQTDIHYPVPCHLQPAFQQLGYQPGDFPNAERLSQEVLSLPIYPGLTDAEIERIVTAIAYLTHSPSALGLRPC